LFLILFVLDSSLSSRTDDNPTPVDAEDALMPASVATSDVDDAAVAFAAALVDDNSVE
jgi:hypothetical protein